MLATSTTPRKFTADTARSFDGFSLMNATILANAAASKGCNCQPYTDWFTFNRWLAQGLAVKKGEHGTKLSIFVVKDVEKDGKTDTKKIPWTTTVFCRCQVAPAKK